MAQDVKLRRRSASKSSHLSSKLEEQPGKKPPKPPKPKHSIYVHANGTQLHDTFQTQRPGDEIPSSPWRIRGARWQKPAKPPPHPGVEDHRLGVNGHGVNVPNVERADPAQGHARRIPLPTQEPSPRLPITAATGNMLSTELLEDFDCDFDFEKELEDLPSDAFASSPTPERLPGKDGDGAILISSQASPEADRPNDLRGPQNGLQQMTLFGHTAEQIVSQQQMNKRRNWPVAQKEEPPTHHALDHEALKTYVYPTNLGKIRDYQFNIVKRGLYHNLLVALPTGLGKTFIAATVMLNWYRWTKSSQIVFVAPTKPLVAQQVEACFGIAGIPRSQTSMLTGGISPGLRAGAWAEKRVFFMTPQTIINDLKTGICDPKKIVLLVVDEAHRATGNYAYVEVVKFLRRFNQSFRILALTATPGGTVENVQAVIDGLGISRVEIRTEFSIDIREYVYSRHTEIETFKPDEEMELVKDLFSRTLSPMLQKLRSQNATWTADPMTLSPYGLNKQRQTWMSSAGKNANMGVKGMVNSIFTILASLAHSIELLIYHGITPFYQNMLAFRNNVDSVKAGKYEREVTENEHFHKMMTTLGAWVRNDTFIGHPKLEHLRSVVLNHFLDAGEGREAAHGQPPSATRIMIFAHFRDSAEDICRVLRRNSPMIRPHVFVGQAASKGSEGMDQKRQLEVIHDFKTGKYNTLVATSIGEEGLDIGEIDLIICYDSSASPVRMLQRMGRTGRKRAGNILLLLMEGKEKKSFLQAKDNYEKMQKMIAEGDRFEFHEETARRIVPKGIDPVVDKRVVEIPVENTQADLPEPKKRGRAAPKRPKKKFNMPDGVRTGFVKASRMDGDDEEDSDAERPRPAARKRARPSKPVEQLEPIPELGDVLLSESQDQELFKNYQDIPFVEGVDLTIRKPCLTSHPERQKSLAPTRGVEHGKATLKAVKATRAMQWVDTRRISTLINNSRARSWDEDAGDIRVVESDSGSVEFTGPSNKGKPAKKPVVKAAPKSAPKPTARAPITSTSKVATKAAARAASRAAPVKKKAPTARGRQMRPSDDDGAMEAASSSPPATDPRMALQSQGIDLGSGTSGEDEMEPEPSSELRDFVVEDDDVHPESTLTSSIGASSRPARPAGRAAARLDSSPPPEDDDLGSDDEGDLPSLNTLTQAKNKTTEKRANADDRVSAVNRKRKVVEDSSD